MSRAFTEFPKEEYQLRYKRACSLMNEKKIDALLITDTNNYRYFSGHIPRTGNRPSLMVLTVDGDSALLASNDLSSHDAAQMSFVRPIATYELPFRSEAVAGWLKEQGLEKTRIGLEIQDKFFGSFRSQLQPGGFNELVALLPEAEFVDASHLLWRLRSVKTRREVESIREASRITARAYDDTFSQVACGMRERDVAVILLKSLIDHGSDLPSLGKPGPCPDIIMDATRPSNELHLPTDKRLAKGDLLHIDTGARYNGYCSDFCRSATVGKASSYQRNMYKQVVDKVYASIYSLTRGMRLSDIECHWHTTGLEFVEGPFGGLVKRGAKQDVFLEPGLVLCIEEVDYGPSGETYHFEEVVVLDESGDLEILSSFSSSALRRID